MVVVVVVVVVLLGEQLARPKLGRGRLESVLINPFGQLVALCAVVFVVVAAEKREILVEMEGGVCACALGFRRFPPPRGEEVADRLCCTVW